MIISEKFVLRLNLKQQLKVGFNPLQFNLYFEMERVP
jgi:hypothetical protein